ncbi:hypothetical protein M8C21_027797, partial [Ambrosia artemisiifolia]
MNGFDTGNHNASSRRWARLEVIFLFLMHQYQMLPLDDGLDWSLHRMGFDVRSTDAIVVIGGGRGCLSIYDIECCHYVSLRPIRTSTLHDTIMLPSAAIQVITNNTSDKLLRVRPPHPSLRWKRVVSAGLQSTEWAEMLKLLHEQKVVNSDDGWKWVSGELAVEFSVKTVRQALMSNTEEDPMVPHLWWSRIATPK